VPRYVAFLDALPKTQTQKVKKQDLRAAGVEGSTWDRLAAEAGQGRSRD
jgi:crotonobetaine/carnitine-CoA ligase